MTSPGSHHDSVRYNFPLAGDLTILNALEREQTLFEHFTFGAAGAEQFMEIMVSPF
jgi:hypothetical protein